MRHTAGILIVLLLAAPAAAQFNFGVSPSRIVEEEPHRPGESFHTQFFVISSSNEDIGISLETADAGISDFRRIQPEAVHNFSAQPCQDCVEFLQYSDRLTEREQSLDAAGSIRRWQQIEFFVNLPEGIEPGYHMLELTPRPERTGSSGSVGLVSTTPIPVVFNVPGAVVRSGRIIGIRAGERTPEKQELVATFYNTGTVTMEVGVRFVVPAEGENTTHAAGTVRVGPGEEARFSARVDAERLNASTPVTASASYTTGGAEATRSLTAKQQVTVTGRAEQKPVPYTTYLFLALFLAVSTLLTWQVIRHVR